MTWSVYVITNRVNGMRYVGQTKLPVEARWGSHIEGAYRPGADWPMAKAIREFGWAAFTIEKYSTHPTEKDARAEEKRLIAQLGTEEPNGYNVAPSEAVRKGNATQTPEQRSARVKKANAAQTPEQRSARLKKANATLSREKRIARSRKAHAALALLSPAERSAIARKAHRNRQGTRRDPRQSSFLA